MKFKFQMSRWGLVQARAEQLTFFLQSTAVTILGFGGDVISKILPKLVTAGDICIHKKNIFSHHFEVFGGQLGIPCPARSVVRSVEKVTLLNCPKPQQLFPSTRPTPEFHSCFSPKLGGRCKKINFFTSVGILSFVASRHFFQNKNSRPFVQLHISFLIAPYSRF